MDTSIAVSYRHWCPLLALLILSSSHAISAQRFFGFTTSTVTMGRRDSDFYAPRDRYPYVASLQHPYTGSHLCVGTLIMKQWVLTYARCIDTKRFTSAVKNPIIALGSENIGGPFKERHLVEHAIFHPYYDGSVEGPYDVALLKLAYPSKIQPLVVMHDGSPPLLPGLETRAMSWSRLEEGGPYSKKLLEITGLEIIREEDCYQKHSFSANISCLHVTSVDICAGGTGGPVVIPSFPDRLVGIAMGSTVCNGGSQTTGYVSIHHVREWILQMTALY